MWKRWKENGEKNDLLCIKFDYFCFVYRYVFIAMDALDQLLMACHSQSINLFVESFLQMVAKLLESGEPELQILGSNSVCGMTRLVHLNWIDFGSFFAGI